MSSSSSKPPPPHLRLHVDSASTAITSNVTAASPGSTSASASASSSRSSSAIVVGGGGSGQNQACAACKYQRRKCNPDCPLAPYFPADQQRLFLNAHRLFGVSNIQKTLHRIDPVKGPEAMWTLIYQSEARAADPVHGCVAIINALREQIRDTEIELQHVRQQIDIYRQAAAAAGGAGVVAHPPIILTDEAAVGDAPPGNVDAFYAAAAGSMQEFPVLLQQDNSHPPPQQLYNYFCYDDEGGDETTGHGFAGGTTVEQLDQHHRQIEEQLHQHQRQIEAVPFSGAFDVKPQALPATTIQHHTGPANDDDMDMHAEHKLARVALKHDDVDHHMEEEPAPTAAPCHLERKIKCGRIFKQQLLVDLQNLKELIGLVDKA
ncbi:hypothetical protein BS78_02G164500 [Paspalum vaginatum]|nr:hypothetical protein BS78_02G164500 [Paspalum vaginatum]